MENQLVNILENIIRHFIIDNLIKPLEIVVLIFPIVRELNPLNISFLGLIIRAFFKFAEYFKNKKRIKNLKSKKIFNCEFILKVSIFFGRRKN
ncbi:MAG: hypothetical protein RLZZ306_2283 [Bacteroidota bacterium]|jgi:hypothetical protein